MRHATHHYAHRRMRHGSVGWGGLFGRGRVLAALTMVGMCVVAFVSSRQPDDLDGLPHLTAPGVTVAPGVTQQHRPGGDTGAWPVDCAEIAAGPDERPLFPGQITPWTGNARVATQPVPSYR